MKEESSYIKAVRLQIKALEEAAETYKRNTIKIKKINIELEEKQFGFFYPALWKELDILRKRPPIYFLNNKEYKELWDLHVKLDEATSKKSTLIQDLKEIIDVLGVTIKNTEERQKEYKEYRGDSQKESSQANSAFLKIKVEDILQDTAEEVKKLKKRRKVLQKYKYQLNKNAPQIIINNAFFVEQVAQRMEEALDVPLLLLQQEYRYIKRKKSISVEHLLLKIFYNQQLIDIHQDLSYELAVQSFNASNLNAIDSELLSSSFIKLDGVFSLIKTRFSFITHQQNISFSESNLLPPQKLAIAQEVKNIISAIKKIRKNLKVVVKEAKNSQWVVLKEVMKNIVKIVQVIEGTFYKSSSKAKELELEVQEDEDFVLVTKNKARMWKFCYV